MFWSVAGLLSELDVLLSFADLASSCPTPYTRPVITPPVIRDLLFSFYFLRNNNNVFLVLVITLYILIIIIVLLAIIG